MQKHMEGISYEIIVVAYRFSPENLEALRNMFPEAKIIESNEIRGFAENHNLALKSSQGTYCLVLNDDTFFVDNTIDILMKTFKSVPDACFVSPVILNRDRSIQLCGRERYGLLDWFLSGTPHGIDTHISKKTLKEGAIFQTAGVSGCCFMARRETLVDLGFFCEDYFFCPEDVALSVEAEKKGYGMYVNTAGTIVHEHAATAGPIHDIILPVALQGNFLFIGRQYNRVIEMIFRSYTFAVHCVLYLAWHFSRRADKKKIWMRACKNAMRYSFSFLPPKMLFQKLARSKGML
jgi:GT2 family glycosyltransferase